MPPGAAQGIGAMNPIIRFARAKFHEVSCHGHGCFPTLASSANVPAHLQDIGMVKAAGGDSCDVFPGFGRISQFEPADRCSQVVNVRRLKLLAGHCYQLDFAG